MSKSIVDPKVLRKILRYDATTGALFWRCRSVDLFEDGKRSAEHSCNNWNSKHAGTEALTAVNGTGYRHGSIFDRPYLSHRVIWAIVHGEWPSDQIDHINGVRDDNRIENLRAVSGSENMRNTKRFRNNASGVTGVFWDKPSGKWLARIGVGGKSIHLGRFSGFDSAVAARAAAEVKFGFHANHGRI